MLLLPESVKPASLLIKYTWHYYLLGIDYNSNIYMYLT